MSRKKQSINLSETTQAVASPPLRKRKRRKLTELDYTGHHPIMTVKHCNRQAITKTKKICKKCQQRKKELGAVESRIEKVEKLVDELKTNVDVYEEVKEEGSNKAMLADWVISIPIISFPLFLW